MSHILILDSHRARRAALVDKLTGSHRDCTIAGGEVTALRELQSRKSHGSPYTLLIVGRDLVIRKKHMSGIEIYNDITHCHNTPALITGAVPEDIHAFQEQLRAKPHCYGFLPTPYGEDTLLSVEAALAGIRFIDPAERERHIVVPADVDVTLPTVKTFEMDGGRLHLQRKSFEGSMTESAGTLHIEGYTQGKRRVQGELVFKR